MKKTLLLFLSIFLLLAIPNLHKAEATEEVDIVNLKIKITSQQIINANEENVNYTLSGNILNKEDNSVATVSNNVVIYKDLNNNAVLDEDEKKSIYSTTAENGLFNFNLSTECAGRYFIKGVSNDRGTFLDTQPISILVVPKLELNNPSSLNYCYPNINKKIIISGSFINNNGNNLSAGQLQLKYTDNNNIIATASNVTSSLFEFSFDGSRFSNAGDIALYFENIKIIDGKVNNKPNINITSNLNLMYSQQGSNNLELTVEGNIHNFITDYNIVKTIVNNVENTSTINSNGSFSIPITLKKGVNIVKFEYANNSDYYCYTDRIVFFNSFNVNETLDYDNSLQNKVLLSFNSFELTESPDSLVGKLKYVDFNNSNIVSVNEHIQFTKNENFYEALVQVEDRKQYFIEFYSGETYVGCGIFKIYPTYIITSKYFNTTVTESPVTLTGYTAFFHDIDLFTVKVNNGQTVNVNVNSDKTFTIPIDLVAGINSIKLELRYDGLGYKKTEKTINYEEIINTNNLKISLDSSNIIHYTGDSFNTASVYGKIVDKVSSKKANVNNVIKIVKDINKNGLLDTEEINNNVILASAANNGEFEFNIETNQVEQYIAYGESSEDCIFDNNETEDKSYTVIKVIPQVTLLSPDSLNIELPVAQVVIEGSIKNGEGQTLELRYLDDNSVIATASHIDNSSFSFSFNGATLSRIENIGLFCSGIKVLSGTVTADPYISLNPNLPFESSSQQMTVSGAVNYKTANLNTISIKVNSNIEEIELNNDGTFNKNISLDNGANFIKISYEDLCSFEDTVYYNTFSIDTEIGYMNNKYDNNVKLSFNKNYFSGNSDVIAASIYEINSEEQTKNKVRDIQFNLNNEVYEAETELEAKRYLIELKENEMVINYAIVTVYPTFKITTDNWYKDTNTSPIMVEGYLAFPEQIDSFKLSVNGNIKEINYDSNYNFSESIDLHDGDNEIILKLVYDTLGHKIVKKNVKYSASTNTNNLAIKLINDEQIDYSAQISTVNITGTIVDKSSSLIVNADNEIYIVLDTNKNGLLDDNELYGSSPNQYTAKATSGRFNIEVHNNFTGQYLVYGKSTENDIFNNNDIEDKSYRVFRIVPNLQLQEPEILEIQTSIAGQRVIQGTAVNNDIEANKLTLNYCSDNIMGEQIATIGTYENGVFGLILDNSKINTVGNIGIFYDGVLVIKGSALGMPLISIKSPSRLEQSTKTINVVGSVLTQYNDNKIKVFVNNTEANIISIDDDGSFNLQLNLQDGKNTIEIEYGDIDHGFHYAKKSKVFVYNTLEAKSYCEYNSETLLFENSANILFKADQINDTADQLQAKVFYYNVDSSELNYIKNSSIKRVTYPTIIDDILTDVIYYKLSDYTVNNNGKYYIEILNAEGQVFAYYTAEIQVELVMHSKNDTTSSNYSMSGSISYNHLIKKLEVSLNNSPFQEIAVADNSSFNCNVTLQAGENDIELKIETVDNDIYNYTHKINYHENTEPLMILTEVVEKAVVGKAYNFNFEASGGFGDYSWATNSNLPEGLYFDQGFSGTPTTAGVYDLIIAVEDNTGTIVTKNFQLEIIEEDNTAPTTSIAKSLNENSAGWFNDSVTITLTSEHNAEIWYKLNNNNFKKYTKPLLISDNGTNTLKYYARDLAGNEESVKTFTLRIDNIKPLISVNEYPLKINDVNFTLRGTYEDISGIDYISVNGSQAIINNNTFLSNIVLKENTLNQIEIIAIDKAGNSSSMTKVVLTDNIQPTIDFKTTPRIQNGSVINSDVVLRVELSDKGKSGLTPETITTYQYEPGFMPPDDMYYKELIFTDEKTYTETVKAEDIAGNITISTFSFTIDKTIPEINEANFKISNGVIKITGTYIEDNIDSIWINGYEAILNKENVNFSCDFPITQDIKSLNFIAIDLAGLTFNKVINIEDLLPGAEMQIKPDEIPNAEQGNKYSANFEVCGGKAPYNWEIAGEIPEGLTLSNNILSGIPVKNGDYSFEVIVTDNNNYQVKRSYTLTVAKEAVINIPDNNLRAAICKELGISCDSEITTLDMLRLTKLNAREYNIENLQGLAYAKNITHLGLSDNNIVNIDEIQYLTKITNLQLSDNKISDLSPVSYLTNLTSLQAMDNNISDISGLKYVNSLKSLSLSSNKISDLTPLASLSKLDFLSLHSNEITDISSLYCLTELKYLQLANNRIINVEGINSLQKLYDLDLAHNNISNIDSLAELTSLVELRLSNNPIISIKKLNSLINIKRLGLDLMEITDISAIQSLTNLHHLNISYTGFKNLSQLQVFSKLEILYCTNNEITDISPLCSIKTLRNIYLSDNNIMNINGLDKLNKLTRIQLDHNNIEDISAIQACNDLWDLRLENNRISNIESLRHLNKLKLLYVHKNRIKLDNDTNAYAILEQHKANGCEVISYQQFVAKIPDENLRKYLFKVLNKEYDEPLFESELAQIIELKLDSRNIVNLAGLEYATSLTSLSLSHNKISEIEVLSKLTKLQYLNLDDNRISDISSLASLTELLTLDLDDNNITNIGTLSSLVNLTELYLYGNKINDFTVLSLLNKLNKLTLGNNEIADLNTFEPSTTLKSLDLSYNNIEDISILNRLTELNKLLINDNHNLSTVDSLSSLHNLKELWLWNTNINDTSALSTINGLQIETEPIVKGAFFTIIDNHENANHQNLDKADIVYEYVCEGSITRFLAGFSNVSDIKVGPIRSSRYYLAQTLKPYNTVLAHVGGNMDAIALQNELNIKSMCEISNAANYFERSTDYQAPHNAIISAQKLLQYANKTNYELKQLPNNALGDFNSNCLTKTITICYGKNNYNNNVKWSYQEQSSTYLRYHNDVISETKNGDNLSVSNIIIMEMPVQTINVPVDGQQSNINIIGSGNALFIRNGKILEGIWSKKSAKDHFTYKLINNEPFTYQQGKVWIHQVDSIDENVKYEVESAPQLVVNNSQDSYFIKNKTLNISGLAEAGLQIQLFKNDKIIKDEIVNESGTFNYDLDFNQDNNSLKILLIDELGRSSIWYSKVYQDKIPPQLSITTPNNNTTTKKSKITISGQVSDNYDLSENKLTVKANSTFGTVTNNSFSIQISLSSGVNTINVIVEDKAGNKTTKEITITFNKPTSGGGSSSSSGGGGGGGFFGPLDEKSYTLNKEKVMVKELVSDEGVTTKQITIGDKAVIKAFACALQSKEKVKIKLPVPKEDEQSYKTNLKLSAVQVSRLSKTGINIIDETGNELLLPQETLLILKDAKASLEVESYNLSEKQADKHLGEKEVALLAKEINTNIKGETILRFKAPANINPEDVKIRVIHSDGTIEEIIPEVQEIKKETYFTFKVNKFSTFILYKIGEKDEKEKQNEEQQPQPKNQQTITLKLNDLKANINGQEYKLDAAPFVKEGSSRTLVPVRFVAEALGAEVIWSGKEQSVTIKDNKEIILTIGKVNVTVDGIEQQIDCAPIKTNRTYVPIRFISETLGAKVSYNSKTQEITINR